MDCIDSHVHFWKLKEFRYDSFEWPNETSGPLNNDYSIDDYINDVKNIKLLDVKGLVYVQVYHTEKETEKIIELSKSYSIIKGIVGWTDLSSENVSENVKRLKDISNGKLIGIRHLIQLEKNEDWLIRPDVLRGLESLQENNLQFDLSCNPAHLKHAPYLAQRFPRINFIIDHMAKMKIDNDISWNGDWFGNMKRAAEHQNVFCKLSGNMSENATWTMEQFEPYYNHVLDCFGPNRCIYGADWPVFKLRCNIQTQFEITNSFVTKYFNNDPLILRDIFYNNAIRIYKLQ